MIDTSESLLDRLKLDEAQEAWREFYHLYWGAILRYARKLGLKEHEAEEVLQETMVTLMRILPEFAYDRNRGRFRNFLLTIVHRKALALMRRASRSSEVEWREDSPGHTADPFDVGTAPAEEALARWREVLMEEAVRRVRANTRTQDGTFAVFEAYVLQRLPADEVARRFGLKENAVYQIRNRVLRRVRAEVMRLARSSGDDMPLPRDE